MVRIRCPYCGRTHEHGIGIRNASSQLTGQTRQSHCHVSGYLGSTQYRLHYPFEDDEEPTSWEIDKEQRTRQWRTLTDGARRIRLLPRCARRPTSNSISKRCIVGASKPPRVLSSSLRRELRRYTVPVSGSILVLIEHRLCWPLRCHPQPQQVYLESIRGMAWTPMGSTLEGPTLIVASPTGSN